MNRLSPLILEHQLPTFARYAISESIMLACAVLQMALQMQTGSPGYFLLLPGVFLSGLIFDRRSGIFAAIIAVAVGAYVSYAGSMGIDYFATNALFAITAAGTAAVAEFQRAELRRVFMAEDEGLAAAGDGSPDQEQPDDACAARRRCSSETLPQPHSDSRPAGKPEASQGAGLLWPDPKFASPAGPGAASSLVRPDSQYWSKLLTSDVMPGLDRSRGNRRGAVGRRVGHKKRALRQIGRELRSNLLKVNQR